MNQEFTKNVEVFKTKSASVAHLKREKTGVVFVEGVLEAGPWYTKTGDDAIADVTSALLDEGTKNHSRDEFRGTLEGMGARLTFTADERYVYFSLQSTTRTLESSLSLLFEAIAEPLITKESFEQVREREGDSLIHEEENTRTQGRNALTQALFEPSSAFYRQNPKEERARTLTLSKDDVTTFVKASYGGKVTMAVVGDIEIGTLRKLIEKTENEWAKQSHTAEVRKTIIKEAKRSKNIVHVSGKESIDVFMGSAIPIDDNHESFPALRVALDLLGGGFSDHLMQTVRDRDGLTYGTYARLMGRGLGSELYWYAWAMFGNSLYEKGLRVLEKEIGIFLDKGITQKRLEEKKVEIRGRYAVLFGDPGRAADELLIGLLSNDVHGSDTYMSALQSLRAKNVEQIAKNYLKVNAIAAAGSIEIAKKIS